MSAGLFLSSTVLNVARRFGILAFLGLGLLDQSIIPLPGSMDALLILFVASRPQLWWYYVLCATAGTTLGAFITYNIAKKGGKDALEKKLGKQRSERAYRIFNRWGFWSVFTGTILPPPVPIVPFLATAGVMQYPRHLFLAANASGRVVRFSLLAFVTMHFGKSIFGFFSRYYRPALYTLIGLGIVGGIWLWFYWRKHRSNSIPRTQRASERNAA